VKDFNASIVYTSLYFLFAMPPHVAKSEIEFDSEPLKSLFKPRESFFSHYQVLVCTSCSRSIQECVRVRFAD
jgi:hypothetical protein